MGLGPYTLNSQVQYIRNPYAWNNIADVILIDQPIGVGFSAIKDQNNYCTDRECYGRNLYLFLVRFIAQNPEYRGRPFFIVGISFGGTLQNELNNLLLGHYGPVLGDYILQMKNPDINFQGLSIGSGLIDCFTEFATKADYA